MTYCSCYNVSELAIDVMISLTDGCNWQGSKSSILEKLKNQPFENFTKVITSWLIIMECFEDDNGCVPVFVSTIPSFSPRIWPTWSGNNRYRIIQHVTIDARISLGTTDFGLIWSRIRGNWYCWYWKKTDSRDWNGLLFSLLKNEAFLSWGPTLTFNMKGEVNNRISYLISQNGKGHIL